MDFYQIAFLKENVRGDIAIDDIVAGDIKAQMEEALADAQSRGWNTDYEVSVGGDIVNEFRDAAARLAIQLYVAFNILKDQSKEYGISWKEYCENIGLSRDKAQAIIEKWTNPEDYAERLKNKKDRQGKNLVGGKGSNSNGRAMGVYKHSNVTVKDLGNGKSEVTISTEGASRTFEEITNE